MEFRKIAVLGGGLLGGSAALAAVRCWGVERVSLWARREETVVEAQMRGIVGATADLGRALVGVDLVILSTPVGVMPGLIKRALNEGLERGALVTDVGSVKGVVHRMVAPVAKQGGMGFVGSHPMAGSEKTGMAAAREDLFAGAACLVTTEGVAGEERAEDLGRFWEALGCRIERMGPEEHDQLVARISHFPHAMAALTARVALARQGDECFGGGGLRDTTRVAGGDPAMWAEIFLENREALLGALEASLAELREVLAMLERSDHEAVCRWLAEAQERRLRVRPKSQDF